MNSEVAVRTCSLLVIYTVLGIRTAFGKRFGETYRLFFGWQRRWVYVSQRSHQACEVVVTAALSPAPPLPLPDVYSQGTIRYTGWCISPRRERPVFHRTQSTKRESDDPSMQRWVAGSLMWKRRNSGSCSGRSCDWSSADPADVSDTRRPITMIIKFSPLPRTGRPNHIPLNCPCAWHRDSDFPAARAAYF